jgi:hypothetical protein
MDVRVLDMSWQQGSGIYVGALGLLANLKETGKVK